MAMTHSHGHSHTASRTCKLMYCMDLHGSQVQEAPLMVIKINLKPFYIWMNA